MHLCVYLSCLALFSLQDSDNVSVVSKPWDGLRRHLSLEDITDSPFGRNHSSARYEIHLLSVLVSFTKECFLSCNLLTGAAC